LFVWDIFIYIQTFVEMQNIVEPSLSVHIKYSEVFIMTLIIYNGRALHESIRKVSVQGWSRGSLRRLTRIDLYIAEMWDTVILVLQLS